jgi:hypothetical protein
MGTLQSELAKIKPPRLDGSEQAFQPDPDAVILRRKCATTGKIEYLCGVTEKIRFLSRRAAQRHADTMNEKAYAYLCGMCNGFHFSRKHWRHTRGKKVRRGRQMVWYFPDPIGQPRLSAEEQAKKTKQVVKELRELMKADVAKAKRGRVTRKPKLQPKRKLGKRKKRPSRSGT